jgi:RND family efflux transporter MFP subunit
MNTTDSTKQTPNKIRNHGRKSTFLTLLVIALILVSALAAGAYIIKSTPKASRQKPLKEAPLVTTQQLEGTIEQVRVSAMGTVIPASELNLKTEVSGRVIAVSKQFDLGSRVTRGERLLLLEPADYQLAIAQTESKVAEAAYNLSIEQGNQEIAQQEWELYDNKSNASEQDRELTLRKPHLIKAQAEYKSAQAELAQAKLNLERTILYAPFNAMVITKSAEPGSYLSAQDSVATLVDTDRYWIQVSIPVDRLSWIQVPQNNDDQGSIVQISDGNNQKMGTVYKLLGNLEESGRMARLLVKVIDPLDLKKPIEERNPLLLGEYVRVEIDGEMLDNVISIPRSSLHNGDQLWLLDQQQQLQITHADVIWRDNDRVLLNNNVTQGMQLITSNLSTPVTGMQLRTDATKLALNRTNQESSHE